MRELDSVAEVESGRRCLAGAIGQDHCVAWNRSCSGAHVALIAQRGIFAGSSCHSGDVQLVVGVTKLKTESASGRGLAWEVKVNVLTGCDLHTIDHGRRELPALQRLYNRIFQSITDGFEHNSLYHVSLLVNCYLDDHVSA